MPDDPNVSGEPSSAPGTPLPPSQKRLLWLIVVVGLAALVLGGVQLQRGLKKPFTIALLTNQSTNSGDQSIEALKAKDTDKDTLTDYDELYVYHTSPYIADSDSDGIADGQEVTNGTDPNCPNDSAQPCGALLTNSTSNTNQTTSVSGNTNSSTSLGTTDTPTAAQIRQALLAAGVAQTDLDKVDDATLVQQYQAVVDDQGASNTNTAKPINTNATTNTSTNLDVNSVTADQLQNLTAAQIRQLLLANGVPQDTLDSYDDLTLKAVFSQAIQNNLANSNTNAS